MTQTETYVISRYFFDFEFIEDGKTIDPVSIGIKSEDGRTYYAVFKTFNKVQFFENSWLVKNVLPGLPARKANPNQEWSWANFEEDYATGLWKSKQDIRDDILDFVRLEEEKPRFYAYYADYDWVTICQLFGKMIDLPRGWPMYCRDLKQITDMLGNPALPPQQNDEHNALADATWNQSTFNWLMSYAESKGLPSWLIANL